MALCMLSMLCHSQHSAGLNSWLHISAFMSLLPLVLVRHTSTEQGLCAMILHGAAMGCADVAPERAGGYGGRGGGGRGRGRGDFDMGPAEHTGPAGKAQQGTAARPGQDIVLPGTAEMKKMLDMTVSAITPNLKVLFIISLLALRPALQVP